MNRFASCVPILPLMWPQGRKARVAGGGGTRNNKGNAQNAKEGPGGTLALLEACQCMVHSFVPLALMELRYYKQQ